MNQPRRVHLEPTARLTHVDPWAAMFNPATRPETTHMILAAFMVTGFGTASVYAVAMLRGRRDRYHRLGLLIPFTVAAILTPVQIVVGDWAARFVADHQPTKLAAMEGLYHTDAGAPLYDRRRSYVRRRGCATRIEIPDGLSLLATATPHARSSRAWTQVPPPTGRRSTSCTCPSTLMVGDRLRPARARRLARPARGGGGGTCRAAAGSCAPPRSPGSPRWSRWSAGWVTTEVGRQPWIVYGSLRIADAVNPAPGIRVGCSRCWPSTPC